MLVLLLLLLLVLVLLLDLLLDLVLGLASRQQYTVELPAGLDCGVWWTDELLAEAARAGNLGDCKWIGKGNRDVATLMVAFT